MKKLLALLLCVAMLLPAAAMAEDGRIHITYSFWGNQTEAESVRKALDEFNAMQDRIFVEPMQIPNEEYTQTLGNYAIANQLPDCGMVNENSVLHFARNGAWRTSPPCMRARSSSPWIASPSRTAKPPSATPAAMRS